MLYKYDDGKANELLIELHYLMIQFLINCLVHVVVVSLFKYGINFSYSGLPVSHGFKNILHEFLLHKYLLTFNAAIMRSLRVLA